MQSNLQQNRSYLHWTKCRGKKLRNLYLTFYLCVFIFPALMEVVNLSVSVTKTSVTIMWEWQRKSEPVRVSRYEAVLRKDSDKQCMWVNEPFNIKSHSMVKKKKFVFFSLDLSMYIFSLAEVLQKTVMHIWSPFCKCNIHSLISSFTFVARWPTAHFLWPDAQRSVFCYAVGW